MLILGYCMYLFEFPPTTIENFSKTQKQISMHERFPENIQPKAKTIYLELMNEQKKAAFSDIMEVLKLLCYLKKRLTYSCNV